jgi:hypothetical protein
VKFWKRIAAGRYDLRDRDGNTFACVERNAAGWWLWFANGQAGRSLWLRGAKRAAVEARNVRQLTLVPPEDSR